MKKTITVAAILSVTTICGMTAEIPSVSKGKELFNSATLGTDGKSCGSCHPGGKGLIEAAADADQELAEIVNACIGKALKGKPLGANSQEMKSLVMYLKSLGKPADK